MSRLGSEEMGLMLKGRYTKERKRRTLNPQRLLPIPRSQPHIPFSTPLNSSNASPNSTHQSHIVHKRYANELYVIVEHDEKLLMLKLRRKGGYSPRVGLACLFLNVGSSRGKYPGLLERV